MFIGSGEIIVVLIVALLILGPTRLLTLIQHTKEIIVAIKRCCQQAQIELEDALVKEEIEACAKEIKQPLEEVKSALLKGSENALPNDIKALPESEINTTEQLPTPLSTAIASSNKKK